MQEMMMDDPLASTWLFPETDISITDKVLGRGSFGEVRIAKWRNIDVAAKRLHEVCEHTDGLEAFMLEMSLLAKLRHPNLVLFIGVCYDSATNRPTTILTELMPTSLYNILEDLSVKLGLADILDIAHDVATGIDYLHSHSPIITHRDISSKNILVGGNRAKITDLGQCKMVSNSIKSQQTAMPGAMAYSAPEVLTGRYSEKIDIYSFGILLMHMCTGDYPRIERREEQLKIAKDKFPSLDRSLTVCLFILPSDRPEARTICDQLQTLKNNDRHYPPTRRLLPQSDLGVMGRRWISEQVELKCKDVKLALEQTTRRLEAEETRWRDEALRADALDKCLKSNESTLVALEESLQRYKIEHEKMRDKYHNLEITVTQLENQLTKAKEQMSLSQEQTDGNVKIIKSQNAELTCIRKEQIDSNRMIADLTRAIKTAKDNESACLLREKQSSLMLVMQTDQSRELEERLEQVLIRWKKEKQTVSAETERCSRLRATNGDLVCRTAKQATEIEMLHARLDEYDRLALSDQMQSRLKDLEEDAVKLREAIHSFENSQGVLTGEKAFLEASLLTLQEKLIEDAENQSHLNKKIELKDRTIVELEAKVKSLSSSLFEAEARIRQHEREAIHLNTIQAGVDVQIQLNLDKNTPTPETLNRTEVLSEDPEEDMYLHRHTTDGAGSNTLMLLHDAFLPEAFGAGANSQPRRTLHIENEDRNAADHEKPPHFLNGDEEFNKRRIASLQKVFGSRGATPMTGFDGMVNENNNQEYLTDEEKRKRDLQAKIEVQHTINSTGHIGLITLLKENLTNEYVLWRASRALRDLTHQNEQARAECVDKKADEIILQVMDAFPNVAVVQGQAIRLLGSLSYGNDLVRRRCGERQGVKRIVRAMDQHICDETVQLHACTTLTNFFHNNIDNRFRFIDETGPGVLVACMERYQDNVNIQQRACWALLTLVGTDEIARLVSESGAISAVVKSMVAHSTDAGVQQFGCWAISNLALAGEDVKRKLKKAGVLEVCRMAMELHSDDHEVMRQARNAIGACGKS